MDREHREDERLPAGGGADERPGAPGPDRQRVQYVPEEERQRDNPAAIRAEDTEPYIGLQYIARLFKIAAMVVVVALAAEIVVGVWLEGMGAIIPLMAEVIQGIVLAAILWGAGDLTLLLIDVGHDVRAARVLLGRLSARADSDAESGPTR
jgi:hypothetical protein